MEQSSLASFVQVPSNTCSMECGGGAYSIPSSAGAPPNRDAQNARMQANELVGFISSMVARSSGLTDRSSRTYCSGYRRAFLGFQPLFSGFRLLFLAKERIELHIAMADFDLSGPYEKSNLQPGSHQIVNSQ